MTGDIRSQLAASDAAESLRMESFISGCFQRCGWPADRGVYYNDPETGKPREIDVVSRQILERPRRRRGVGAPLTNIYVLCECKSLSGWNILFSRGEIEDPYENRMPYFWSGHEEHILEIVEAVSKIPAFQCCNRNNLYGYYTDRAYPDGGAIACHTHLPPPPVELIATAFRETKGGSEGNRRFDGQGSNNPLWNAIRSVLAATNAAEARSLEIMRSYTMEIKSYLHDDALVESQAFFFDAELMRHVCYHPVVFCKARLFQLNDDGLNDIKSARIYVRDLSSKHKYVDVVSIDVAAAYIEQALSHFECHS
jgi:hypothetical protein